MATFTTDAGIVVTYADAIKDDRSPKINLETDRSSATRVVYVPYPLAETFAEEVTGYQSIKTFNTAYAYVSRVIPWRLPLAYNRGIFCSKCFYEGFGVPRAGNFLFPFDPMSFRRNLMKGDVNDGTYVVWDTAKCKLEYETPTYDVLTDTELQTAQSSLSNPFDESTWLRFVTKIVKPQGEFFTITGPSNSGYYFGGIVLQGGPFAIGEILLKASLTKNIQVTWHQVPQEAVPDTEYNPTKPNLAIDFCMGRVNDRTFNGHPQGTLLLLSADIQPRKNSKGERIYDIVYQFKQKKPLNTPVRTLAGVPGGLFNIFAGHNHQFAPPSKLQGATTAAGGVALPDGGWFEILGDQNKAINAPYTNFVAKQKGINPYDYGNFANLFRPAAYTVDIVP